MDFVFSQSMDQKLNLNHTQILSLKLLAMNSYDLENYLNEMQLENPFIQVVDEREQISSPEIRTEDSYEGRWISKKTNDEAESWETYTAAEEKQDLYHIFSEQIGQYLTPEQDRILKYMTGIMDDSGLISADDDCIAASIQCHENEVRIVRNLIQQSEPLGSGSKNIIDCIYVQLEHKGLTSDQLFLCKLLLDNHLQDIAEGKLGKIAKMTNTSREDVLAAVSMIKQANPIPLNGYGEQIKSYIVPDIIIEYEKNEWTISLNQSFSNRIRVCTEYEELMHAKIDAQTKAYCRNQKRSAIMLKRCLEQRDSTILRITSAILARQYDFALGKGALNPMQMRDIAEEINVHESTISRAIKDKYIQFPRGIYELRTLFQRSYGTKKKSYNSDQRSSENLDSAATTSSVKEMIRKMINEEDSEHPLSDQVIADRLSESGCDISRRTVAKYRESMLIKSTRLRKKV